MANNIKQYSVPQFEGLTIDAMLQFAENYPEVKEALPSEKSDIKKLPREYLANVLYTLTNQDFDDWVETKIKKRNDKIKDD